MNFLFFSYAGPFAGFIYLEVAATTAADLNLWYTASSSTVSRNVMNFLWVLGVLPASLVGPTVLLKVYGVALT